MWLAALLYNGRRQAAFLPPIEEREPGVYWRVIPFIVIWSAFAILLVVYLFLTFVVPQARDANKSEKKFTTIDEDGKLTTPEPLPSWYDKCLDAYREALSKDPEVKFDIEKEIDDPEVLVSIVVPAFNEEKRLIGMLEEAVEYLEKTFGSTGSIKAAKMANKTSTIHETTTATEIKQDGTANGELRKRGANTSATNGTITKDTSVSSSLSSSDPTGWEILIIDDGSQDKTLQVAHDFTRSHILPSAMPRRGSGPWSHRSEKAVKIPAGSIRFVSLLPNRGKGGAVAHGLRHARGKYVVFADADGATDFKDLGKLIKTCKEIEDKEGRAVVVGSRAHLVGSEAVVKRSKLRNFLMHAFHVTLKYMTPPKTAQIKDTQCGFKLLSRPSLPWIVPHLHIEGWIFDVELLMLAEWNDIPVKEVAVTWKEVGGSKLNVVRDSIGMAWGLAMLRFCWTMGIYAR